MYFELYDMFIILQFKNRRCLLHDQCVNFTDYNVREQFKLVIPDSLNQPGLCVDKCPAGTKEDNKDKTKCVPCVGKCPRGMLNLRHGVPDIGCLLF